MQIELSAAMGAMGAVISFAALIIVTLGRIAIANREKELDRRIDEVRLDAKAMNERLHTEEKTTIRQDGEIKLITTQHAGLQKALDEINEKLSDKMVTKAEFQQLQRSIEGARPQYRPTPGSYQGLGGPPSVAPPRPRDRDKDR